MEFLSKEYVNDLAVNYYGSSNYSITPHSQTFAAHGSATGGLFRFSTIGSTPRDLVDVALKAPIGYVTYCTQVNVTIIGSIDIRKCDPLFVQRFQANHGVANSYSIALFQTHRIRDYRTLSEIVAVYNVPHGAILENCGTVTELFKGKFFFTTRSQELNLTVEVMPYLLVGYLATNSSSATDFVYNSLSMSRFTYFDDRKNQDSVPFFLNETTADNILLFDTIAFNSIGGNTSKCFSFIGYRITPNFSNSGPITYQSFNG